ncbi:hypothetical protein [Celerinatantimonas sp. MCCC 1A17872]|uniref:hypothetical protein n=1 Tax=Celerinatantimonas sp. MCCC 1A17872 TaxID=3177514 RepID=UPI0038C11863
MKSFTDQYTKKVISIMELRRNPSQYFSEEPIAITSHNKLIGYTLGKEQFEYIMSLITTFSSQFDLSRKRLDEIAQKNAGILGQANLNDLGDFQD